MQRRNLNGRYGHVDSNFVFAYFLESGHRHADVVQVLQRASEALQPVLTEREDGLHLGFVLLVARLPVLHAPLLRFGQQTCFQFF